MTARGRHAENAGSVGVVPKLSVQQLTAAAIVLLLLFSSIAVSGLVWSSTLLERTSAELVRAGEDLRLARDFEQALFSHQRLTILARSPGEGTARALVVDIDAARQQAGAAAQAELLDALAARAADYFALQASLMERDAGAAELSVVVRPAFDAAVDAARALARYSELELELGNVTARRLGDLFRLAAMLAAALALALVALIGFAVRRLLLEPILAIREALVRFRGGDYDVQADENIARELGEIAAAFNEMKTELARRRAERLAFLGGVAHDLRNPLSALTASVQALEIDHGDPALLEKTLRVLSRQLVHLERMCGDLLEVSRMEAGEIELHVETFDLCDAAVAVVDLYRPAAGTRELVLELDPEPVMVQADRVRIEQAIGNLVKNAIKYSGGDTRVSITVSRRGDAAEIAVTDHGVGIPQDELDTIFRPFRHGSLTPATGAGLGLAVVQRIVAAHGGSIGVESRVGAGSTFQVRLPLTKS